MRAYRGNTEKVIAAALIASLILLAGCGSGGGGGALTGIPPANGTISGTAIKGFVSGAAITAFGMNSDGTAGSQIGTATTDAQGDFSVQVGSYAGAVMLRMTGGTFTDEATGTLMIMGFGDMLTALVPLLTAGEVVAGIQMTPLTSMAQRMAQNMLGGMAVANITQANSAVGQYFGVSDILHIQPMNPLTSGAGAAATQDQRDYGMTIAAISQYAHTIGMADTSSRMVTAMMNDASDGRMDGMMGGSQIMMGGIVMQANAGTVGLANAMQAFLQSGQNHSGLTVLDMQALLNTLSGSDGTILSF